MILESSQLNLQSRIEIHLYDSMIFVLEYFFLHQDYCVVRVCFLLGVRYFGPCRQANYYHLSN